MKKVKNILKNNFKLVLGMIIGIVLASTTVYAATILFASDSVSYSNTNSGLTSTNVQGALDELYTKANTCKYSASNCTTPPFNVGDYVEVVPDSTSYTITTAMSGYTSNQTINPSELKLWRVINKYPCNVELVSEYVSSSEVYFSGPTAYANFVGIMQEISRQYTNKYVSSTRMFGYHGQTEYVSNTTPFNGSSNTAPTKSATTTLILPSGTRYEYNYGALGDDLSYIDKNQIGDIYKSDTTTYGTYGLTSYKVNATTTEGTYWMASRDFLNYNGQYIFYVRYIDKWGNVASKGMRKYNGSSWENPAYSSNLRPIITLKSGVTRASGSGTKASPYKLS